MPLPLTLWSHSHFLLCGIKSILYTDHELFLKGTRIDTLYFKNTVPCSCTSTRHRHRLRHTDKWIIFLHSDSCKVCRGQLQVKVDRKGTTADSNWFKIHDLILWINRTLWTVCPRQRIALCPVLLVNRHCAPVVLRRPWPSQFRVSVPAWGAEGEAEKQREAGVSWRTAEGFQPILPGSSQIRPFW